MAFADEPLLLAAMIFLAEMCVVTVSTVRIIFISRGHTFLAPLLGFFEIVVWLFAVGQVMTNLEDTICFWAFATGFTTGNLLGMWIEQRLALGMVQVRVITPQPVDTLAGALRQAAFGVTCIKGEGSRGLVNIVVTVVARRQREDVVNLVQTWCPGAFYSIEEIQTASAGSMPVAPPRRLFAARLRWRRRLDLEPHHEIHRTAA